MDTLKNKSSTTLGNDGGTAVMEPEIAQLDTTQIDAWSKADYDVAFKNLNAFGPDVAARITAGAKQHGYDLGGTT